MVTQTSMVLGQVNDIEEFAKRIKTMMRGGEKLSNSDAISLAQFSKVTGLNPFIGECWWIPGSGAMVGIAGARRLDQERTAQQGGYSFPVASVCTPEEAGASEFEVKDVVAAFKTEINDSAATAQYTKLMMDTIQVMRASGVEDPFGAAKEICGPRPVWTGYGFSKKSDPTKMSKVQVARKRSEADALKKRIVIPFGAQVADSDISPDYVDAQDEPQAAKKSKEQNLRELGFSDAEKNHDIGLGDTETEFPINPEQLYKEAAETIVVNGGKEKTVGELTLEQLQWLIENGKNPNQIESARIVLEHDFSMS